ncbi:G-patch domain-containing protein [Pseudozyma hubeiensis]|nr:G-patch domain-containing protein [Pseudozyma hubeiensis]
MAYSSGNKARQPIGRPRAFDDSDDDNAAHDASSSSRRREEIVSFGRDGAKGRRPSPKPTAPRVIPVVSNLDWRQDRKERLGRASNIQALGPLVSMRRADSTAVPGSASGTHDNSDTNTDAINTEAQKRGLELRQPRSSRQDASSQKEVPEHAHRVEEPNASAAPLSNNTNAADTDEEALKALLAGQDVGSSGSGEPLIIQQESESELLQHDIDSRPEAPTLDDYAATPIDQFGMALLRGMGWKEGMGAGKGGKGPQQAAEPKKRAALLGLGAKERPGAASSLPASSSSSRSYRPKDKRDYKYVPVAKAESPKPSNGRSADADRRPHEDRHSESRSRGAPSSRDSRREKDDRHSDHSRSSHRYRSKSPPSSRDYHRDRHRDRPRDDRNAGRRSHTSSRSDRDRRSHRDRDERRDRDYPR